MQPVLFHFLVGEQHFCILSTLGTWDCQALPELLQVEIHLSKELPALQLDLLCTTQKIFLNLLNFQHLFSDLPQLFVHWGGASEQVLGRMRRHA